MRIVIKRRGGIILEVRGLQPQGLWPVFKEGDLSPWVFDGLLASAARVGVAGDERESLSRVSVLNLIFDPPVGIRNVISDDRHGGARVASGERITRRELETVRRDGLPIQEGFEFSELRGCGLCWMNIGKDGSAQQMSSVSAGVLRVSKTSSFSRKPRLLSVLMVLIPASSVMEVRLRKTAS